MLENRKPGTRGRYSTAFRIMNFEYFMKATPATIAMGIAGTVVSLFILYDLFVYGK